MRFFITAFFFVISAVPVCAQIVLDGTIGLSGQLKGPDFNILAEYGQQSGANLFHSFSRFNINTGESATFSGPDSVRNIIGRVTGGDASWIDGKLRSAIPDADLYFLNPAGVMFGPNASLDTGGSFHVSTADYLRMGNNNRFFTESLDNEMLSVAAPAAFGFLDNDAASITIEGKGEIAGDDWNGNPAGLTVGEGRTISVIGGDIEMSKGTYFRTEEINDFGFINPTDKPLGSLTAPGGQINIVSKASEGEVNISGSGTDTALHENYGNITISGKSLLNVSGSGAGKIFIRTRQFYCSDSILQADNYGALEGGEIRIQADEISFEKGSYIKAGTYGTGMGASINFEASDSVIFAGANALNNNSRIFLNVYGQGNGGSLLIKAKNIMFKHGAIISSSSFDKGKTGKISLDSEKLIDFSGHSQDKYYLNASFMVFGYQWESTPGGIYSLIFPTGSAETNGEILINTENLFINDSAFIMTVTTGPGNGGNINIHATGEIVLKGASDLGVIVGSISTESVPSGENIIGGDAGNIFIEAGELILSDGCLISSSTSSIYAKESGRAGDITIRVSGEVRFSDVNPFGFELLPISNYWGSGILSSTVGDNTGDAGSVSLHAKSLILDNGGTISVATNSTANGGEIDIQVRDSAIISGSSPSKIYTPETGEYTIYYCNSAILANTSNPFDGGAGGHIYLSSENLVLSENGEISTSSSGSGEAGDIFIETERLQLNRGALISSASRLQSGGGSAGTITIAKKIQVEKSDDNAITNIEIVEPADSVILKNNSSVTASAENTGSGDEVDGRITISSGNMLYMSDSEITTSVQGGAGNGGDIEIGKPEFAILNHSRIGANAYEGAGGNIHIIAGHFIRSSDSILSASSGLGIDGEINIESPDTDHSSSLTVLPGNLLDATRWMKTPCAERTGESVSRFVIRKRDAEPFVLDDLRGSPPVPFGFLNKHNSEEND